MAGAALASCLATAPVAEAAPAKVRGAATITRCAGERVALAFSLAGDSRVRGATLRVSAVLYPLLGFPQPLGKLDLGRARRASRTLALDGLAANRWTGVVRYRWKRGRRTVAFGAVRTQAVRVGRRRGRASCTLPVGRPPVDDAPPLVYLVPEVAEWLRGPVEVRFVAWDNLSGVHSVGYQVDGGPASSGRSFTLASEGEHSIVYAARDLAGNVSPARSGVVRVDTGAPSAPDLSLPFSITGDTTPEVRWSAATDSGSGVRSYLVTIKDAAGSIIRSRTVGPSSLSATIDDPLPAGNYQAQVLAVDGATPEPFVTGSAPRAFEVRPGPPQVTGSAPADGEIVALGAAGANATISFDRPMDPASIATSLSLTRLRPAGGGPAVAVSCDDPCTTATLDPSGTLPEGVYDLKATTGARSLDGDPLPAEFVARFSVPFFESAVDVACVDFPSREPPWTCGSHAGFPTVSLGTPDAPRPTPPEDLLRRASTATKTLNITQGEVIRATVTRLFRRTTDCDDKGDILLTVDGTQTRVEPQLTVTTPPTTVSNDFSLDAGTNRAIRLDLELALAHSLDCGEAPGPTDGLYVDDIQLARKP